MCISEYNKQKKLAICLFVVSVNFKRPESLLLCMVCYCVEHFLNFLDMLNYNLMTSIRWQLLQVWEQIVQLLWLDLNDEKFHYLNRGLHFDLHRRWTSAHHLLTLMSILEWEKIVVWSFSTIDAKHIVRIVKSPSDS